MNEQFVTAEGKLVDELLPAVYFDTSVVIDYWKAEGMENDSESGVCLSPYEMAIRDLLKADRRVTAMVKVRKALQSEMPKVCAVTSPLTLLEVMEEDAEASLKSLAVRAVGVRAVQRMSKKETGEILCRLVERRRRKLEDTSGKANVESADFETLWRMTWPGLDYHELHESLAGILVPDIVDFSFSMEKTLALGIFAYLQMGAADIFHLLLAQHYGCSWVASFDTDFARCRHSIQDVLGLSLLTTPEEILKILDCKR